MDDSQAPSGPILHILGSGGPLKRDEKDGKGKTKEPGCQAVTSVKGSVVLLMDE